MIELNAEGHDAEFLPFQVNNWINVYLEARSKKQNESTSMAFDTLHNQFATMGNKIAEKREYLDQFRPQYDIYSMRSEENLSVARLKGLTETLNKAHEEKISAKAHLDAVRSAVAQGRPVVPEGGQASLENLEARAQEVPQKLTEPDRSFTREYMALLPDLKAIPEQFKALEKEIENKLACGKTIVLRDADR